MGQEVSQLGLILQVSQSWGVWRRHVDDQGVCVRTEVLDPFDVVLDLVAGLVFAEVDCQHLVLSEGVQGGVWVLEVQLCKPVLEFREDCHVADRVEAVPVDDGVVLAQSEEPWGRVARLWHRGDGADFDVAEAQAEERVDHLPVLVEPCRHADGVGERLAEDVHLQDRVVHVGEETGIEAGLQALDAQRVALFGAGEEPDQRAPQVLVGGRPGVQRVDAQPDGTEQEERGAWQWQYF